MADILIIDDDPEMQTDYREIMDQLTRRAEGFPGEGTVPSTLRQMSDEEADRVAELIIDFCFSVACARIEEVFKRLKAKNLTVKLTKCDF